MLLTQGRRRDKHRGEVTRGPESHPVSPGYTVFAGIIEGRGNWPRYSRHCASQGGETMIVDLRTELDVQTTPYVIPGALRISPEDLERRHSEIPREVEIVLYCT